MTGERERHISGSRRESGDHVWEMMRYNGRNIIVKVVLVCERSGDGTKLLRDEANRNNNLWLNQRKKDIKRTAYLCICTGEGSHKSFHACLSAIHSYTMLLNPLSFLELKADVVELLIHYTHRLFAVQLEGNWFYMLLLLLLVVHMIPLRPSSAT